MRTIKYFVGGAFAGAIFMFFVKLIIGTQWGTDDIKSIIFFGFIGLLYFINTNKKK